MSKNLKPGVLTKNKKSGIINKGKRKCAFRNVPGFLSDKRGLCAAAVNPVSGNIALFAAEAAQNICQIITTGGKV